MYIWDCVVVRLRAVGSSVLHHLARCGADLIGFEQFEPDKVPDSSHGAGAKTPPTVKLFKNRVSAKELDR